MLADKIPAVNHINDLIQTLIRPAAGAVAFAASAHVVTDVHPVLALACGLLVAGDGACRQSRGDAAGHRHYWRHRQHTSIHRRRCDIHGPIGRSDHSAHRDRNPIVVLAAFIVYWLYKQMLR